jgi:hypothetical protein
VIVNGALVAPSEKPGHRWNAMELELILHDADAPQQEDTSGE